MQNKFSKSALGRYCSLSVIGYSAVFLLSDVFNRILGLNELSFILTYLIVYTLDFLGNSKFVFRTSITRNMLYRYLSVTTSMLCAGTLLFKMIIHQIDKVSITTVLVGILVSPIRFTISAVYVFGNSTSLSSSFLILRNRIGLSLGEFKAKFRY